MAITMSVGAALCLVMVLFAQLVFVQTNAQAPMTPPMYAPEMAPMAPPMYAPEMAPMMSPPAYAPEMSPMKPPMMAPGPSMMASGPSMMAPGPAPMMSSASRTAGSGVALLMGFAALLLC